MRTKGNDATRYVTIEDPHPRAAASGGSIEASQQTFDDMNLPIFRCSQQDDLGAKQDLFLNNSYIPSE